MYSGCVREAAGAMVDVYRFDNVLEKLDQERLSLFWLQFVAQCGEYAEAFQEAMIERTDRKTAEKIFAVLNLLDPFADDEIKLKVAPLQKVYAEKAYTMTQNLPSHLIDRFVEICIELCRRKTAIAQALADGSFVTLLTAIQDGVYVYSEEQDLQPPEVRAIVRQQMCKAAFAVLADCL
ncbi:hypothetical protein PHLGIDRAFT_19622 [Phlebiopsis gigantea 11061_1 CR5-6]|uniref:Uncharacterized protein n=1 Tax=Phlebiopsis gigantea (strain 11061_1 CR5-6) TaxID=745531 RepID=A0A0C3S8Y1_PHLG1|nr:hypothetical protein PHLGIDRAFT_19622 [Phlebiopsis gigantea 11061_1 CR5-6]